MAIKISGDKITDLSRKYERYEIELALAYAQALNKGLVAKMQFIKRKHLNKGLLKRIEDILVKEELQQCLLENEN